MKTVLNRWIVLGVLIAVPTLVGCQQDHHDAHAEHEHPSHVEEVPGTDLHRVTWTVRAAERTGLETAKVAEAKGPRQEENQLAVPYGALLYTPDGKTWVYEMPEPRTFIRHPIEVDYIDGDMVYLKSGPPAGTEVASVGVAEIYGSEFEVGH